MRYVGALEDCMGLAAGVILSGDDGSLVPKIMSKVLTHLRQVHSCRRIREQEGCTIAPTAADLTILVLTQALIPFGATLGEGDAECYGQFPAAVALGERATAFPAVAEWLKNVYCNLQEAAKGLPAKYLMVLSASRP